MKAAEPQIEETIAVTAVAEMPAAPPPEESSVSPATETATQMATETAAETGLRDSPRPPPPKKRRRRWRPNRRHPQKGNIQRASQGGPKHKEPPVPADIDATVTTINIAQLQAMSMGELNLMAKEMGIENFGTMKKHEVIFQILQKMRNGAAFSFRKVSWRFSRKGFGFLRSQSFNYLPVPRGHLCLALPNPPVRPANRAIWWLGKSARPKKGTLFRLAQSRGGRQ